jgi:hypothetical protein
MPERRLQRGDAFNTYFGSMEVMVHGKREYDFKNRALQKPYYLSNTKNV